MDQNRGKEMMARMQTPQKRRVSLAKAKLKSHTVFRMNILFFVIFLLFSALILRLGYLQIVKGEDFTRLLARTEEVAINTSVPRGRIFDSQGRIQVDNKPVNAITYTAMQTTKRSEMMEVAEKLATLIEKDTDKVTERDKKDYYISLYPEETKAKVSEEEQDAIWDEDLTEKEKQRKLDDLIRERITEEELASLTDQELEVLAIYREMTSGYALTPMIIKNEDVTPEEFARVSERLTDPDMKGVNTVTDWERVRSSDLTILGTTTTPEQGIPESDLDYYLSRDYSRNDRVGRSFLEQQYESVLQGQKSVVKSITDGRGRVIDTVPDKDGEPGKDLILSIDTEMQAAMEEIVESKLLELKRGPNAQLVRDAYLVMMDPRTGEILSLVGKRIGTDDNGNREIQDYAYGALTAGHEVGSSIKGATVLAGYSNDAIGINSVLIDEPMKIGNDRPKASLFNRTLFNKVAVNDLFALEISSNVYMFKIALGIAGASYQYGEPINIPSGSFNVMRNSFAQFGLGVKTGIDLPNEGTGYLGTDLIAGKLLDLSIGQFDTYTSLQLVQYISTIANGGYRMEPHLVKEIRQPSPDGVNLGAIDKVIEPRILNRVDNTPAEINRVKEGMRLVYEGSRGTARRYFTDAEYSAAGKTGTAEVTYYDSSSPYNGQSSINTSHVGFAPYDNPEVAFAVLIPYITTNPSQVPPASNEIGRAALDKYFELKKKKASESPDIIREPFTDSVIEEGEEE